MDHFLFGRTSAGTNAEKGWAPAVKAVEAGLKVVKVIGYDCGPADSRRAVDRDQDARARYWYPLRDWGWDRERCTREIEREGLIDATLDPSSKRGDDHHNRHNRHGVTDVTLTRSVSA